MTVKLSPSAGLNPPTTAPAIVAPAEVNGAGDLELVVAAGSRRRPANLDAERRARRESDTAG